MRILVTGGAGFLGAHLCTALLARGDEVVAVDNFATSNRDMVEQLTGSAGFTFIEGDICANPSSRVTLMLSPTWRARRRPMITCAFP